MKFLLLLLTLLTINFSFADCAGSGIYLYPENQALYQNSLILIEGYAADQELIQNLNEKCIAKLVSKNDEVILKAVKSYKGMMWLTMAALKPERNLKAGETYEFVLTNADGSHDLSPSYYDSRKSKYVTYQFKVLEGEDKSSPKWLTAPTYKESKFTGFGCGPAKYGIFNAEISDDSYVMVETELRAAGQTTSNTYLIPIQESLIKVGHGMCSGGFTFDDTGKYEVRFRLNDICGNHNNWTAWITFDAPSY